MTLTPYKSFPVDALPRPLAQYVREGAAALGCDAAMVALPAIAACGSLIGNTRTIRIKNIWREPSVFWTCVVADSGTLKSPAMDLAIRPLHQLQKRLKAEHAARFTAYLAGHEQWKARKANDASTAGDEPEKPILPRVVCSDTTIERLGELWEENPRGLLLARDELNGWLKSFERYSKGSDLPQWLEFHRAGHATIDRKTGERKSLFIDRAAVSVCGTIQPGILAKAVRGDFLDSGLVACLLMCMPPKYRKQWRDVDLDPATVDAYERLLESLYRLDFGTNGHGERTPVALALDADAARQWRGFYNAFGAEQADAEGERAAALAKLEGYTARFVLLHHVCEHAAAGVDDHAPIRAESIDAGVTLCRWFAREAERVYTMFGETSEQRESRRLVEFIAGRGGSITARDLQRTNGGKYPTAAAAESALDALADAGRGSWTTSTAPGGGRPSRVFRLARVAAHDTTAIPSDKTPELLEENEVPSACVRCRAEPQHALPPVTKPAASPIPPPASVVMQTGKARNETAGSDARRAGINPEAANTPFDELDNGYDPQASQWA